jgi:outer membrane receptor protein involved in Fe transport
MMLNLPLVHDRLAVRVVGYDEWLGGYIRDGGPRSPVVDRTLRGGGRVAVRYQIDPDWRIDVSTASQTLETADTHYTIPTYGRYSRPRQLAEAHHNAFREAAVTLNGSGDWGSLTSTTGFVSHRYSSDFDASSAPPGAVAPPAVDSWFTEEARTRLFTQDVTLRSPSRSRLRWMAGVYVADVGERLVSSLQDQRRTGQLAHVFDKDRVDHTLEGALYGDVTYDLGAGWTASVGARAFQSRLDHHSSLREPPLTGSRRLALSFGGVSPTASLSYALGPSTTIYALYSEGYRPGGVNAIGRYHIHHAPVTFSPDQLQNYEIGMTYREPDQRLWARVSGFRQSWRRVESDLYSWAGSPFTANVGDVRNLGVGVEGGYDVSPALSAQLQFQATAANLVHWDSRFVTRPARGLPGVPEVSGGGLVEYRRPLTTDLFLLLVAQASYVGPSHVTFDASSQTMGGYFADRLSADVTMTRWTAGVFIDNVADEAGDTFAFGNPFSFGRTRQVTPQRPRTIGLRLSARL